MAAPDFDKILASLSLDEKITILAGKNFWETFEFPDKGVPSLKVSDGPNGARGATFTGGVTAACFPSSTSLASTFDIDLAHRTGAALAEETKTKGAYVLLGPTVCLHRHPLGGRNFESFSEDPLLAGDMAAHYINGLQENGVGATIKHFAVNEQETDRFTVNATVSERALREIYLKPFEIAVKKANPWAFMTSYNLVNGFHADASDFLLQKVLRGNWGWKGLVMSDWGGTNSTAETINAGQDLEMPGPTRWRRLEQVKEALKSGKTTEAVIDERVRNILALLEKTGKFEDPTTPDEQAINKPEHQALIRSVGGQGVVMLKNENSLLPLTKSKYKGKKVAILGLAKQALMHGGGSASVNAHYSVTPWDGLKTAWGEDVEMVFAPGAQIWKLLPAMTKDVVDKDGKSGFSLDFFDKSDFSGTPVKHDHLEDSKFMPLGQTFDFKAERLQLTGTFKPPTSGKHYLGCSGLGPTQLFINGESIFHQKENNKDFMGFLLGGGEQEIFQFSFEAGKSYEIKLNSLVGNNSSGLSILDNAMGFYLGFMPQQVYEEDVLAAAIDAAKSADVAVVFTGHTPDWETEGQDQKSFNLPARGSLDKLVSAIADANPNVVVVNSTGTPVAFPWLKKVQALLQTWFPGQEAGNAIADVLTGAINPSGKLPTSFPKKLEYSPAFGNFPGEMKNGRLEVEYKEGVFMGYRHYDREDPSQLEFPFGFGLSFTTFTISDLDITQSKDGSTFVVSVKVQNTGSVAGAEVIQVYSGAAFKPAVDVPLKQLVGFTKAFLQPGETKSVKVEFETRQLAYFDEDGGEWVVEQGQYDVYMGTSVRDIKEKGTVAAQKRITFAP